MCTTCGCSDQAKPGITNLQTGKFINLSGDEELNADAHNHDHVNEHTHPHTHTHQHDHEHAHDHRPGEEHTHEHTHTHSHLHSHDDPVHDHTHAEESDTAKPHEHEHTHTHSHPHSHSHDHSHDHDHSHAGGSEHNHDHAHAHGHSHDHDHDHVSAHLHSRNKQSAVSIVSLNEKILAKNDGLAKANRQWLTDRGIVAINLVSSPGSGKTTLLERTIKDLKDQVKISVVEGDQETLRDAKRIKDTGCDVVQINTGAGCHLEADMLDRGLKELHPNKNSLVMIENVGNLVCPALFDLGEHCKVAILSVTEGEDKPLKYPHMFRAAEVLIINKTDLLPYVNFDVETCIKHALTVNPSMRVFKLSATKGEGLNDWYDWLKQQVHDFLNE